jgi:putative redox protein
MVRIDAIYEGDLHTVAVHEPSQSALSTDAPVDNRGRGESYSPTDLLATAVGTCMLTVMGIAAREKGWQIEGARLAITKHMAAEPRRVGRLVLHFEMPGGVSVEAREGLEHAARTCPVAQSIHPGIELDVQFSW